MMKILISLLSLNDQRYKFHLKDGTLKVCKGSMVFLKVKIHFRLHYLQVSIFEEEEIIACGNNI